RTDSATVSVNDEPERRRRAMKARSSLRHVVVLACLFCALSPRSLRAQTPAEADRAAKLFLEARALVAEDKYAEACPKFEESQRLDPGLGTQYNLALCLEKVGKLGSAWRNFAAVERDARKTARTGRQETARQKM